MNRESQGRWNWWGEADLETKGASRQYINFLDYMTINLDQVPHEPKNILLDKEYLQLFLLLKISEWELYLGDHCPATQTIYRKLKEFRPDYVEYKKEWWRTAFKRTCNGRWFPYETDKERYVILESIREELLSELLKTIKRRIPMPEMSRFVRNDYDKKMGIKYSKFFKKLYHKDED